MKNTDRVTTQELASLLQTHDYTLGILYGTAQRGRRLTGLANRKLYSLKAVAKIISAASGFKITAEDLQDLITREQAVELYNSIAPPRSKAMWSYWGRTGQGPRTLRVGSHSRYIQREVVGWAEERVASGGAHVLHGKTNSHWKRRPTSRSASKTTKKAPNGPNAATSASLGVRGGAVHFSLSEGT